MHIQQGQDGEVIERPYHPDAIEIWQACKTLPHTVDWGRSEWLMLRHATFLADQVYSDPDSPVSKATELRRVLASLGFTADDRARLGIRYIDECPQPEAKQQTPEVLNFRGRR